MDLTRVLRCSQAFRSRLEATIALALRPSNGPTFLDLGLQMVDFETSRPP